MLRRLCAGETLAEEALHGVTQVVQESLRRGKPPVGLGHSLGLLGQMIPRVLDGLREVLLEDLDEREKHHVDLGVARKPFSVSRTKGDNCGCSLMGNTEQTIHFFFNHLQI